MNLVADIQLFEDQYNMEAEGQQNVEEHQKLLRLTKACMMSHYEKKTFSYGSSYFQTRMDNLKFIKQHFKVASKCAEVVAIQEVKLKELSEEQIQSLLKKLENELKRLRELKKLRNNLFKLQEKTKKNDFTVKDRNPFAKKEIKAEE